MSDVSRETRKVFNTLKTEHQKILISMVFDAHNQTKAYMAEYPDCSYESARRAVSVLMTNDDMKDAKQELLDELKEKSQVSFEWCAAQLVEAIKGAKDEDKVDYNAIKGSVNELNKMLGHHAAEKKDITTKGESLNTMSDDQIDARLQAIVDAAAES